MRETIKSKGVETMWYDELSGKWAGSVLLRYDVDTELQLRRTIDADTKEELIAALKHFRETNPPIFMY